MVEVGMLTMYVLHTAEHCYPTRLLFVSTQIENTKKSRII